MRKSGGNIIDDLPGRGCPVMSAITGVYIAVISTKPAISDLTYLKEVPTQENMKFNGRNKISCKTFFEDCRKLNRKKMDYNLYLQRERRACD